MAEWLFGFVAGAAAGVGVACAGVGYLFLREATGRATGTTIVLMDGDEVIGTIMRDAAPPEFWDEMPRTLDRREPVEGNPGLFNEVTYRRGERDTLGRYVYRRMPGGRVVAPFTDL